MAAAMKSVSPLVVLIIVLVAQTEVAMTQSPPSDTCANSVASLNVCAPFAVPGGISTTPSPDCCNALRVIDHGCMCNMLRIAARIPALCNLPALNCPN